jgi:hypothetical protein
LLGLRAKLPKTSSVQNRDAAFGACANAEDESNFDKINWKTTNLLNVGWEIVMLHAGRQILFPAIANSRKFKICPALALSRRLR